MAAEHPGPEDGAVFNYIKPHWQNGAHAVHDAPNWVLASIEQTIANAPRRGDDELVRIEHDAGVGLTTAWIQCSVDLESPDDETSYRTARYVHALAMIDERGRALTGQLAEQLFASVYGTPLQDGVANNERILQRLSFPDDRGVARGLFARLPASEPKIRPGAATRAATPSLSSLLSFQSPNPVELESAARTARETPPAAEPEPPQPVAASREAEALTSAATQTRPVPPTTERPRAQAPTPRALQPPPPAPQAKAATSEITSKLRSIIEAGDPGELRQAEEELEARGAEREEAASRESSALKERPEEASPIRLRGVTRRLPGPTPSVPQPPRVSRRQQLVRAIRPAWQAATDRLPASRAARGAALVAIGFALGLGLQPSLSRKPVAATAPRTADEIEKQIEARIGAQIEGYEARIARFEAEMAELRAHIEASPAAVSSGPPESGVEIEQPASAGREQSVDLAAAGAASRPAARRSEVAAATRTTSPATAKRVTTRAASQTATASAPSGGSGTAASAPPRDEAEVAPPESIAPPGSPAPAEPERRIAAAPFRPSDEPAPDAYANRALPAVSAPPPESPRASPATPVTRTDAPAQDDAEGLVEAEMGPRQTETPEEPAATGRDDERDRARRAQTARIPR